MELIIALIIASAVALGMAILSLMNARPVQRRLARLADGSAARVDIPRPGGVLADSDERTLVRVLTPLAEIVEKIGSVSLDPLRKRLVEAGYRADSALVIYMGSRLALALVLPVLMMMLPAVWRLDELRLFVMILVSAALGFVAPSYVLDRKRRSRQAQITRGLPDALDLMVVCVESGLGINASLARVAREFGRSNPPLSAEFELVTLETRAGKSTTDSLRSLSKRTGVSEISSLVAMMVQTERFGTSLGDTLRVHADYMRVRRLQRAEEQAAIAPLKMLFPTVIIFAATLMVVLGPAILQFVRFFSEQGISN
jgi:tight adherence protein C